MAAKEGGIQAKIQSDDFIQSAKWSEQPFQKYFDCTPNQRKRIGGVSPSLEKFNFSNLYSRKNT